jgi:hypothetical protein
MWARSGSRLFPFIGSSHNPTQYRLRDLSSSALGWSGAIVYVCRGFVCFQGSSVGVWEYQRSMEYEEEPREWPLDEDPEVEGPEPALAELLEAFLSLDLEPLRSLDLEEEPAI